MAVTAPFDGEAEVIRWKDGDTVRIWLHSRVAGPSETWQKTKLDVRLQGWNAPETRGVERPLGLRCWWDLKRWATGRRFTLVTDWDTDRYGRLLGDLLPEWRDGDVAGFTWGSWVFGWSLSAGYGGVDRYRRLNA